MEKHFENKDANYSYHSYIKDHLGSNRMVVKANAGVQQVQHYYPFGLSFAETTNRSYQSYKYNGKELISDEGLNRYDYLARVYDPALPIFTTPDPMAEKYYSISPYVYCANNPVKFVDPTGMYFDEANEKKARKIEKKIDKQISKLEKQVAKIEKKGGDASNLNSRISELKNSKFDISDMWSNENTEFRYAKASDKNNPAGKNNPTIDGLGTNTVTMYVESNMGSQLHESRHGGDVSRGTLTLDNYNVNHEVSAYQAQYSWDGILRYFNTADPIAQSIWQSGLIPMSTSIAHFNQITPDFVNRVGVLNTVNNKGNISRGIGRLYPPRGININKWNNH